MRDYTHAIAVSFVDKMNEYRRYTESERIVITYGLEIFLNNFIKLITQTSHIKNGIRTLKNQYFSL